MTPIVSPGLHELIRKIGKHEFYGRVVIFDPGETTGFAAFERTPDETRLIDAEQLDTWPLEGGVGEIKRKITTHLPIRCVYETYHVYKWKLDQHTFSEVPTIQIIGCIKTFLIERGIPYSGQTAQIGKGFCTDDKLKVWNLYLPGLVHARDAIRHGCQFLLFGSKA